MKQNGQQRILKDFKNEKSNSNSLSEFYWLPSLDP